MNLYLLIPDPYNPVVERGPTSNQEVQLNTINVGEYDLKIILSTNQDLKFRRFQDMFFDHTLVHCSPVFLRKSFGQGRVNHHFGIAFQLFIPVTGHFKAHPGCIDISGPTELYGKKTSAGCN